jgi:hypothetical protein
MITKPNINPQQDLINFDTEKKINIRKVAESAPILSTFIGHGYHMDLTSEIDKKIIRQGIYTQTLAQASPIHTSSMVEYNTQMLRTKTEIIDYQLSSANTISRCFRLQDTEYGDGTSKRITLKVPNEEIAKTKKPDPWVNSVITDKMIGFLFREEKDLTMEQLFRMLINTKQLGLGTFKPEELSMFINGKEVKLDMILGQYTGSGTLDDTSRKEIRLLKANEFLTKESVSGYLQPEGINLPESNTYRRDDVIVLAIDNKNDLINKFKNLKQENIIDITPYPNLYRSQDLLQIIFHNQLYLLIHSFPQLIYLVC